MRRPAALVVNIIVIYFCWSVYCWTSVLLYAKIKKAETEETRRFCHIFIISSISVGGGTGPLGLSPAYAYVISLTEMLWNCTNGCCPRYASGNYFVLVQYLYYGVPIRLPEKHFPEKDWPEKHFSERTLSRMYIWPNEHFPKIYFRELTLAKMYIWQNGHFPVNLFSIIGTCQNVHLVKWIFSPKPIFQI